jgi:hypothetical protein
VAAHTIASGVGHQSLVRLSTKLANIIGRAGPLSIVISQLVAIKKAPSMLGAEDITKPRPPSVRMIWDREFEQYRSSAATQGKLWLLKKKASIGERSWSKPIGANISDDFETSGRPELTQVIRFVT